MKTNNIALSVCLGLLAWGALSQASTITVDIADTSSLDVTNVSTIFGSDPVITTELISSGSIALADESSTVVDLFNLTIDTSWFSLGTFDITASVDFLAPDFSTSFSDTTSFYIASGTFVDGLISWDLSFDQYVLDDGTVFQIELQDISLFDTRWVDNTIVISATLSNLGVTSDTGVNVASVPEPSTMLLLATGLLGMGFARYRKMAST